MHFMISKRARKITTIYKPADRALLAQLTNLPGDGGDTFVTDNKTHLDTAYCLLMTPLCSQVNNTNYIKISWRHKILLKCHEIRSCKKKINNK